MSDLDLPRLRSLDLFAGYGGITRALEPWSKPVAYCEIDRYCQAVLLSEMWRNQLPTAPIWDDVRTLRGDALPRIDLICGGFPCQDLSYAGRGAGLAGERSRLFFEIVRLAKETRAPFLFLENVPAIRTRGLSEVVRTLTEVGYDCRWTCVSAESVGAPHKRERWFLLAYADGRAVGPKQVGVFRCSDSTEFGHDGSQESLANSQIQRWKFMGTSKNLAREERSESGSGNQFANAAQCSSEIMANAESVGSDSRAWRWGQSERTPKDAFAENWWAVEPNVGRVVNGSAFRVQRLRALGNGVVPLQARQAFKILMGLE